MVKARYSSEVTRYAVAPVLNLFTPEQERYIVGELQRIAAAMSVTQDILVEAGGGSDTKEYAAFYLSTGGVPAVAATETTLTINSTSVNSNTDVFSLASSQVTVDKAGDFLVSAECYFNTGGSSRSEYTLWLEVDGVEVAGTRTGTYPGSSLFPPSTCGCGWYGIITLCLSFHKEQLS